MGHVNEIAGNQLDQLFFCRQRCFGIEGQTDAGRYAEYMGIDGHIGLLVYDGGDDIGRFAAYSGQLHQLIDGQRDFSMEFFHQHLRHTDQVSSLVIRIGNAFYKGEQVVKGGFGKRLRIGVFFENSGSGEVDPFVGALCRQDDRYQELVWVPIE